MRIRKKTPAAQPASAMTAEKFCEYVDFLVELYLLNPELPEIVTLKEEADQIVAMGMPRPHYYLAMLNPKADIHERDGVPVVLERWLGHVLRAWSLARHHCPDIDEELVKIIVDQSGAHLITNHYTREREVFWVLAAAINPHRLADPGNRYEIACELIRQFTGIHIDFVEHVGSTRSITVTRELGGNWQVEFDRVSATSS